MRIRQLIFSQGLGGAEEHVRGISRYFAGERPGPKWRILHSHLPKADVCGFLWTRCPVFQKYDKWVVTVHGEYKRWRGRCFLPVVAKMWAKADGVVAISKGVKEWLVGMGVSQEKIRVIYYGVDVPRIQELSMRSCGGAQFILGSVGRLEPRKGFDILIRAMPEVLVNHPRTMLKIVGRSDRGYGEVLKRLVHGLGIDHHVEFLGELPHEKINEFLSGLTLYVQPSREEGLGLAVLEAMAAGKAVVVSDIPAFREVVPEWYPTVREGEWGEKLSLKLRMKPSLSKAIGDVLREHVRKNFSVEAMVEKLEEFYENL